MAASRAQSSRYGPQGTHGQYSLIGSLRAMPTSTKPFEVLLELTNDTPSDATIQLTRIDGEQSGGPAVLLQQGESVSLILNAGATYHYRLRQMSTQARIS